MPFRSYRLLPLLAAFPLIAAFATPANAQSAYTDQCAVGMRYEPGYGPASVIRIYGSVNGGATLQQDAAVCSDMIGQGWAPMSKYGEWQRRNGGAFRPVCGYAWPWGDDVNVYTLPGNENYGIADCANFTGGTGYSLLNNF
jgi:hypothetical protein